MNYTGSRIHTRSSRCRCLCIEPSLFLFTRGHDSNPCPAGVTDPGYNNRVGDSSRKQTGQVSFLTCPAETYCLTDHGGGIGAFTAASALMKPQPSSTE